MGVHGASATNRYCQVDSPGAPKSPMLAWPFPSPQSLRRRWSVKFEPGAGAECLITTWIVKVTEVTVLPAGSWVRSKRKRPRARPLGVLPATMVVTEPRLLVG